VGRGYTVQIGNQQLVDFTGTFNNGNITIGGLTRGTQADAGWHMVGNPYPAPLDWGTVPASALPGVDAAVYVFQSTAGYVGRYRSFVNGVGAGTNLIPAGQGFFIRASTAGTTGSISLTNNNRRTTYAGQPSFQRTTETRPLLHLRLAATGAAASAESDDAFIYFEAGASAGYTGRYDAFKLPNSNNLYLSSVTASASGVLDTPLSVDGRAPLAGTADEVVPLWVSPPAAGAYTLTAEELLNFGPAGTTVFLRDALTGSFVNLSTQPTYSFAIAAGASYAGRFSVVFRPAASPLATRPQLSGALASLYPNPTSATANASATLTVAGLPAATRALQVSVLNAVGQQVGRYSVPVAGGPAGGTARAALPVQGLAAGIYLVRIQADGEGGQLTQRLVVE
jgi:hypothetical protein